ncbi:LAGLIDADG family homing endonuclease [Candidatus Woesearchaeota archaeon]|nr:LAGLIDADG family homing endonuclease [Candidatus Woesearchaeota archaeon]
MAYILGFTCSDGNIHGKTLAWDLSNKFESNKKLLEYMNQAMNSNYLIEKRKQSYRLRISNSVLLEDIQKLGILPNKSKTIIFPDVPNQFLRDFIRGVLDGDGWITVRNRKNRNEISIGFSSASIKFMEELVNRLDKNILLSNHNLRERKKTSKKGVNSIYFQLDYYSQNAYNLIRFLYDNLNTEDLYLDRKFEKQILARKIYLEYSTKTKRFRETELEFNSSVKELLEGLMFESGLNGVQIAKKIKVHSSTVYRWLEKTNVRKPTMRGSEEWKQRIYRN